LNPAYFSYEIIASNSFNSYERTDYNILQFIGDVGALFSTLHQILGLVLNYLFQLSFLMHAHLINGVFRLRNKRTKEIYPSDPLLYVWQLCRCEKRQKYKTLSHISGVASRRIERELDIVYFLRKQLTFEAILHAMTTKYQRSLARQNYRLKISAKEAPQVGFSDMSSTEESGSDYKRHDHRPTSKLSKNLISGIHKHKRSPDTPIFFDEPKSTTLTRMRFPSSNKKLVRT
jgi:hypothetical protein